MMNSEESKKIECPTVDESKVQAIQRACRLGPLASRLLVSRGVDTPDAAREFLSPSLARDWNDPLAIPGMQEVADALEAAIRAGKRILVFGDFDVDGITATSIAVRGLRSLGAEVEGLIPHRYDEGYALSEAAIQRGLQHAPDVIVTVDCGISCASEAEYLRSKGVDVLITDHHEPSSAVPKGVPVTDPKLDPSCPSRDLAGAGVALKLICLLGRRFEKPDLWLDLIDLAALGTIADLMPLTGENRALVSSGVNRMKNDPRMGIQALAAACSVDIGSLTATKLSFSLIPRLNAAGRMGDATSAYELLMSDDIVEAQRIASELESINDLRRQTESELSSQVQEQLDEKGAEGSVIVVAGQGWHEGVKGIVASRIARANKKPTIIFTIEDGQARGSGRTYGGINLFELAEACSDLFDKFGGHSAAIGITLPESNLDELRRRLSERLDQIQQQAPSEAVKVDCPAALEECSIEQFSELEMLEPFGNSNPAPMFVLKHVFLEDRGVVGKLGNHFRYNASNGVEKVSGIFFSPDDLQALLDATQVCDIVFEPQINEYKGRKTPKLMTKDILFEDALSSETEMSRHMEELFALKESICEQGDYAGVTQMPRFNTKVVGVTFENRQDVLKGLEAGVELELVREPGNEYDANAIAVQLRDGSRLGHLNRHLAAQLAPVMDSGVEYDACVSAVTGGPQDPNGKDDPRSPGPLGVRDPGVVDRSYGVNIVVRRLDMDLSSQPQDDDPSKLAQVRERWRSVPAGELESSIKEALIGEHDLHAAQADALASLSAGKNTLAVMATGRGKSLIFHLHAAMAAIREGNASVFIYPLRALVADQAFHLKETFARFGLGVEVLTGETSQEARDDVYRAMASGDVNCILTTPEFLSIHADRFAACKRVGFVVVDEAHHIALSKAGNRSAYANLDSALETLGRPLVLAVTATAGKEAAAKITEVLSIEATVLDPSIRDNLHIDDKRDVRNREQYLANVVASGGKCVIYVNSRDQSVTLTRMLRQRLPRLAPFIGFYNAGLSKADRKLIEDAFRAGELQCIVSTSAFGEGIDIPDIEHVVLYHLPFNDIEFNQMSGRAGRDGRDATIHMLFGYKDAGINEKILGSSAPPRQDLVALYKALKQLDSEAAKRGDDGFSVTNSELSGMARKIDRAVGIDESGVSCGISVFRELGFLQTSGASVARYIRLEPNPGHMELDESVRYREGQDELEEFKAFKSWALKSTGDELLKRFNRPILPENPEQQRAEHPRCA